MKMFSKKLLLVLLVLVVSFSIVFAGCAPKKAPQQNNNQNNQQNQQQNTQKEVTIQIYFPVSTLAPEAKLLDSYAAAFHKEYPNITVKPVYSGGYTDVEKAIKTVINGGGEPPALAIMLATDLYDLIDAGYIVPLDSYINSMPNGQAYLNDFFPQFLANSKYEGKIWSIPFQRSVALMYYNADLLKENNLPVPDSWQSLAEVTSKLTKKDKDGKVVRWGIEWPSGWPYWLFQPLAIGNGTNIFKGPAQMNFNDPRVIEAVQYYIDLSHKYHAMPEGVQKNWNTAVPDFENGRAAFILHSTSGLNGILQGSKFNVGVMAVPGKKKGTYATVTGGGNIYMFKNVPKEKQDAAWKFIEFVTQPKYVADFSINTGYIATRKSAYDLDVMKQHLKEVPQAAKVKELLKYAGPEFSCHDLAQVRNIFHKYLQAAYNGQMTPKAAMDEAQKEAQAILKDFQNP